MDEQGKRRAADYVAAAMEAAGFDESRLVTFTELDPKTVRTFLRGETYPKTPKRQAIEVVLELPLGSIERAAQGLHRAPATRPAGDPVEVAVRQSELTEDRQDTVLGFYKRQLREQREDRAS